VKVRAAPPKVYEVDRASVYWLVNWEQIARLKLGQPLLASLANGKWSIFAGEASAR